MTLVRHCLKDLTADNQAGQFTAGHPGVQRAVEAIVARADSVMPEEAESTAFDLQCLVMMGPYCRHLPVIDLF